MHWLRRLWARFLEWFRSIRLLSGVSEPARPELEQPAPPPLPAKPTYAVVHLSEDPDEMQPETLYAIGENGHLWHVMMVCPCGCGATIALNVLPDDSPRWTLYDRSEGPSLVPSVWRTTGCRSHFILRRGEIHWYHDRRPDEVSESEYGA